MPDRCAVRVPAGLAPGDRLSSAPLLPEDTRQAVLAAEAEACLAEIAAQFAVADAECNRDVAACDFAAQVARAEARRDLAYDLQRARLEQALVRERVGIARVEREARLEVEDLEIRLKEKELVHSVHRPAEAERYRVDTLTEAELNRTRRLAEADAEAIRLRGLAEAEAIRAVGLAEAEVIRQKALAEAEGIRARHLAEARPAVVIVYIAVETAGHRSECGGVEERDGARLGAERPVGHGRS
ncbi:MAG: hypothetical protein FJX75_14235 [Armatimonadetes bacterium]|nr:hypothetical protein [Armatimonadota bacterium]